MRTTFRMLAVLCTACALAACVPQPTAANSDTIDLGTLGAFAEPALVVTAEVSESYSPYGPRSTVLEVVATEADGTFVASFTMGEQNVSGPIEPATKKGEYAGVVAPPRFREFAVARAGKPIASTYYGSLQVHDIVLGERTDGLDGWTYEIARLRAPFSIALDSGVVNGYLTIG